MVKKKSVAFEFLLIEKNNPDCLNLFASVFRDSIPYS